MTPLLLPQQRGFTLLETLTVAAVAGLLAAASAPLLQDMASGGASEVTSQWQRSLNQARTEAIASGQAVTVCASVSGTACDAQDWSSGWLVSRTSTGPEVGTASRQVIESYLLEDKSGELKVFDERLRKANTIEFNGRGFSARDTRTITTLCGGENSESGAVVIERSGRVHFSSQWSQLRPTNSGSLQQISDQELYETICRS